MNAWHQTLKFLAVSLVVDFMLMFFILIPFVEYWNMQNLLLSFGLGLIGSMLVLLILAFL